MQQQRWLSVDGTTAHLDANHATVHRGASANLAKAGECYARQWAIARQIGADLDAGLAADMSKPAAIAHLLEWAATPERQQALCRAIGGTA